MEFTVLSAGDILPHTSVYEAARQPDGRYDFTHQLAASAAHVRGADLALCSLEIPIAPEGTAPSGYPTFGAPKELIAGLKETGWDGCTIATNHTADRGFAGLEATLTAFAEQGLGTTGAGRSDAERERPAFYRLSKDGRTITVAHVAGTYGLNGYPDPGRGYQAVNLLADLAEQARLAREGGADVVVVSPHWGVEYQSEPTAQQRDLAEELVAGGNVDAIIGAHPHVPQAIAELEAPDGSAVPVIYSTGNFFSGQDEACCVRQTATGVMVRVTLLADDDGVRVTAMDYTPVTMDLPAGRMQYLLTELQEGERPEGVTLSEQVIAARWEALLATMGSDRLVREPAVGGAEVEYLGEDSP
ncbi:MAG: CapA family protein [Bowdeniella nasicola]|nr:CapA family protein [Bowdeniella nasicola]